MNGVKSLRPSQFVLQKCSVFMGHYGGRRNVLISVVRMTVYGRGRGLRGLVGVGWCACDMTNHVHAHLAWVSVYYVEWFGTCGEESTNTA